MSEKRMLHLRLRSQELVTNARGYAEWKVVETEEVAPAAKTALIICDMWDRHWSRGATARLNGLVGRMNEVVAAARAKGALIVHAPSDVMEVYADHPARTRLAALPTVEPPADLEQADPPLPIDDSDGGTDTGEPEPYKAFSRQHEALEIRDEDAISDNGREIYSLLRQAGIERVLIMGVHTNMCILHRTFGIKQMVKWGVPIALVRDLTDAMYHPARSPYVNHDEGTQLVIGYIEKFWCPTVDSRAWEG